MEFGEILCHLGGTQTTFQDGRNGNCHRLGIDACDNQAVLLSTLQHCGDRLMPMLVYCSQAQTETFIDRRHFLCQHRQRTAQLNISQRKGFTGLLN